MAAFFWLFSCSQGMAESVVLSANEISKLLTGNTAEGLWKGGAYKQFFHKDGSTIYAPRKARSSLGKWRVDPFSNRYESWWQFGGWESYQVVRDDEVLGWIDEQGEKHPFVILSGQQLVWSLNSR